MRLAGWAGPGLALGLFAAFAPLAGDVFAAAPAPPPKSAAEEDAAAVWERIESQSTALTPPAQWSEQRPSQEMIAAWRKQEGERLLALADLSRDFSSKFPNDTHAAAAKVKELQAVTTASRILRDPSIEQRLDVLETSVLKIPDLSSKTRYAIRATQVTRKAGNADELEKGARELLKEFPAETEPYKILLYVAKGADQEHSRAVAEEILKSKAPTAVKAEAQKLLSLIDIVGKPLNIQFAALDGREVDLQKMKGKVVLIDFWATWCAPCVGEIPSVKATYAKLRDKGFEIVGVSFDQDKGKLEEFLKDKDVTWPQYFDGKGWENKVGQEFGIDSIPRMWLVDKKGVLRDIEARSDLANKAEKLLAEP